MRLLKLLQPAALLASLIAWPAASHANACNNRVQILPVARVVEIDAASGPLYGVLTKNAREPNFLGPKEVVLTFDDGPLPWITRDILATLDRFCAKATFFSVGQMAVAYPETLREIIARGHTLGTHTWSHPLNLRRKTTAAAIDEIERGFAGVTAAAGVDVAPFFRFPGLSDSPALLAYLQSRHIATFTVDVVSNDSYINDPARLLATSLARVEAQRGGIILMHDIKASTARMLPALLTTLAERGYKLVHMVPKDHFEPRPDLMREVAPRVAAMPADTRDRLHLPFYGAVGPVRLASVYGAPVTELASAPRDYLAARPAKVVIAAVRTAPARSATLVAMPVAVAALAKSRAPTRQWQVTVVAAVPQAGWVTTVKKVNFQRPPAQPALFKW